ncbi:MAG: hypothetical protein V2B18_02500 [Pseudomonadota bacterium]
MISANTPSEGISLLEKGRELLEKGDISSAVAMYGQAHDPESVDETEARSMLIEARAHLAKKFIYEALESFEEALLMGTAGQRRQALDGITSVGTIKTGLRELTLEMKKGLKKFMGKRTPASFGLFPVSEEDNLVLVSGEAMECLPGHLSKSTKFHALPPRLSDYKPPFPTAKCVPYTDEADVRFILEIASHISQTPQQPSSAT